jgi:hypothetical protein
MKVIYGRDIMFTDLNKVWRDLLEEWIMERMNKKEDLIDINRNRGFVLQR